MLILLYYNIEHFKNIKCHIFYIIRIKQINIQNLNILIEMT